MPGSAALRIADTSDIDNKRTENKANIKIPAHLKSYKTTQETLFQGKGHCLHLAIAGLGQSGLAW